jgi:hypothetical protein
VLDPILFIVLESYIAPVLCELSRCYSENIRLRPFAGEVAVGGAHMDPFFRYEALRAFVRSVEGGYTRDEAVAAGNEAANFAIRKWNYSRGRS